MRDVRTLAGMMMSLRKLARPFSGLGYLRLRIYRHNFIMTCIFASFSTDTILEVGEVDDEEDEEDAEDADDEGAEEEDDVDGRG